MKFQCPTISFCSLGAYVIVTTFMLCTWRPMQNATNISSNYIFEMYYLIINLVKKNYPLEWDRGISCIVYRLTRKLLAQ